jgi:pyruvate formate lyase activating enzyme
MPRVVMLPPDVPPDAEGIKPAGWWRETEKQLIRCDLCPRNCLIAEGKRGFCFVRENRGGQLVSTTYGQSTGFCIDPIEKKPLNHFFPGTAVLSFGTAGCNLGCTFCQNWTMSRSRDVHDTAERAGPPTIAKAAAKLGCRSVAFTYNDPIIWAEYAIDTAVACHELGVKTVAVTSGYITAEAREAFFEHIDAANVDLKGFSEQFYKEYCGASLEPVLDTLKWLADHSNVWLEITNLIIPQANDSPAEMQRMCRWIAEELGPDVPMHFTAFHPDFKMVDRGPTPIETLDTAYELAKEAGLRYVYTGNVSDRRHQSTYCPNCGQVVVERIGYQLGDYQIAGGLCRHCGAKIAGHFDDTPGDWGQRRMPVRIADFA